MHFCFYEFRIVIIFINPFVKYFTMMTIKSHSGTATIKLENTIGFYLRNAGFKEEVINEIVEALEWKSEFEKFKEERGINTS